MIKRSEVTYSVTEREGEGESEREWRKEMSVV